MRILLTGAKGQLGWEILRQAPDHACDCVGIDIEEADLTDPDQVDRVISATRPDLLIHAAAYTRVDAAQTDKQAAFAVNRDAAGHLAAACDEVHIPMVHISTDFVFDGKKVEPYLENDPVAPLSIYGQSKAAGEEAVRQTLDRHLIIRTAWLYGIHGSNFVKSMLRLVRENQALRVVSDQIGCPTFAADIAGALLTLCGRIQIQSQVPWGTYHLCGRGAVSWHGFAQNIMQIAHRLNMLPVVNVTPISTAEYPTAAPRPAFSVMSCEKIQARFGIVAPPWQTSLENMLKRLSKSGQESV
ncbi:MAG: dTDP-4-dehydrorhamnose reductase [Desulfobacterales bacterium]|nr:dTDP-4-dehydrorhamnose reductase [Desulfobacterales bacterium]